MLQTIYYVIQKHTANIHNITKYREVRQIQKNTASNTDHNGNYQGTRTSDKLKASGHANCLGHTCTLYILIE